MRYIICTKCRTWHKAKTNFCNRCGNPLTDIPKIKRWDTMITYIICASCNSKINKIAKFCPICGIKRQYRIIPPKIPPRLSDGIRKRMYALLGKKSIN